MLLVLLGLAGVVFVVLALSRRAQRKQKPELRNEPIELFKELLNELELSPSQRRVLWRVADDLQIAHPSVLVLCPALYDRHTVTWQRRFPRGAGSEADAVDDDFLRRLRRHLFPDVLARIGTRHMEWGAATGPDPAERHEPQ